MTMQVWDVDLQRHEGTVKDIILVAQGEMALEEFLKQVKETWNTYELDLINYQNKCRIIRYIPVLSCILVLFFLPRGWDDLFNKLKENINQVAAMKLSPYYKVFEEEAMTWEDKLNRSVPCSVVSRATHSLMGTEFYRKITGMTL
jgi:dynein heavy chain 1